MGQGRPKTTSKARRRVPRVRGERGIAPERVRGVRRPRGSKPLHASYLEDRVLADLTERGVEYEYEPKTFKYERKVRGAYCARCASKDVLVSRRYTPDIKLAINGIWVEVKGKFTAENRGKMEDFRRSYPDLDLRFIFQRDNWITKKHKSKYSDWCEKLGLKWTVGDRVPDSWLNEESPAESPHSESAS